MTPCGSASEVYHSQRQNEWESNMEKYIAKAIYAQTKKTWDLNPIDEKKVKDVR